METGLARARLDLDTDERFVSLHRPLGITTMGLNQMVLRPGQRGRIHVHARQEEVFLVWEGTLTVATPSGEMDVPRGELLRVAPDVRRQLVNRGPERCVVIAMGSANPHEGRDGTAFASWEDETGAAPQEIPLPDDLPEGELRS